METDFLLKHWVEVKRSRAMKTIFFRSSAHPGLAEGERGSDGVKVYSDASTDKPNDSLALSAEPARVPGHAGRLDRRAFVGERLKLVAFVVFLIKHCHCHKSHGCR